jgi:hypothetical protein
MPNRSPSPLFDSPVSSFSRDTSPARLFAPWTGRTPQPSRRWTGSPSRPLSQSQRHPIHGGRRIVERRCRARGGRRNPSIPTPVGALRVTPPVAAIPDSWGNRGDRVGRPWAAGSRVVARPVLHELSTLDPRIATTGPHPHRPPRAERVSPTVTHTRNELREAGKFGQVTEFATEKHLCSVKPLPPINGQYGEFENARFEALYAEISILNGKDDRFYRSRLCLSISAF